LLVPGSDLRPAFYAGLVKALDAKDISLHVVDLQGKGAPTWDAQLEALAAVCHEQRPTMLLGHSLGALHAQLHAARASEGLERVVLLEPAICPWAWLARFSARAYRRGVVEGQGARFVNKVAGFRRVANPGAYPPAMIALYERTRRELDPRWTASLLGGIPALYPLPKPKARTLVVRGASSGWRTALMLWALRGYLGAKACTIPRAGHWLANEADEPLAVQIARFRTDFDF
jgi:pimeloyl-ACP methyl ester carboxylesterase